MTLPPPILHTMLVRKYKPLAQSEDMRQEVTEIVLASPRDCITPAFFCGFCNYLVIYFEGKIRLRFKCSNCLLQAWEIRRLTEDRKWTDCFHRTELKNIRVGEYSSLDI